MNKWQTIKLKEVVKIISGYAFKSKDFKENNGIPVIKIGNINYYDVDICKNISYVDKSFLSKIDEKFIIRRDDILISLTGSHINQPNSMVGRVGKYREDKLSLLNQRAGKIMPEKNVCREFIYHLFSLKSMTYLIATIAYGGANQVNISPKTIENLKIKIPDLKTQEKIADILSTYDELIENNNRRIEILEKTAEEIYKEWFVRMRFLGYEKTKFIKGIPEGWEVKRVGDLAKVKSGYAFKSKWWQEKGIPVIKIKDIQNNTIELNDLSYVSEENAEKSKQFYVSAGDLLIAMTGATIGKIALVPYYDLMTVNQRVGKFFLGDKPQEKVAFLYCLFLQSNIREQIVTVGSSNAAQPNISPFDIEKIKILYNESAINLFNKKITPCISLILKLQKQNQNLIKQRDLLLPRLMNGTIEVK